MTVLKFWTFDLQLSVKATLSKTFPNQWPFSSFGWPLSGARVWCRPRSSPWPACPARTSYKCRKVVWSKVEKASIFRRSRAMTTPNRRRFEVFVERDHLDFWLLLLKLLNLTWLKGAPSVIKHDDNFFTNFCYTVGIWYSALQLPDTSSYQTFSSPLTER